MEALKALATTALKVYPKLNAAFASQNRFQKAGPKQTTENIKDTGSRIT